MNGSHRNGRKQKLPGWIRSLTICAVLVSIALFCSSGYSQNQNQRPAQETVSDLARQNLERVAASAEQLESVLHKDAGLMVELKRWVAKDATDHGQLVIDSDLTDQAICDRLESDVQFRSVATLLVQKYGYLLPEINPDSPQAKEQELVIEDRAKWLAQDQEQQLTQARQPLTNNLQQARTCDPRQGADCNERSRPYPVGEELEEMENPQEDIGTPVLPQRNILPPTQGWPGLLDGNSSPLEQAQLMQPGMDGYASSVYGGSLDGSLDSLSSMLALFGQAGPGSLTESTVSTSPYEGVSSQMSRRGALGSGASLNPLLMNSSIDGVELPNTSAIRPGMSGLGNELPGRMETLPRRYETEDNTVSDREAYRDPNRINASQAMLRQPVPYVDVPSLYDMYLQAVPQPPSPERFGMEVFENGTRDKQIIPFDLPAGPDYVVGPGDGLAINLWGGVSQRILRTVDREGKLSLPEAGPLLVAGKSLAEVQESVQKTLRSQFRDISADVSLSRLRTIRVYVVGDIARPGAYDISSLSTPLNALFAARGPTNQGSLRILKHSRGNQLVQTVDVYDLLLHGVTTDIQRLENGDTVLVPPIGPEVTVEGMVRRPAIYELHDEKSLSDVLTLAGGLLPTATLRHIEVERVVAHDKRTMLSLDVSPDADPASTTKQLDSFRVQDGDKVRVFPIAPYNQDTLYLEGHVLRPGRYSYRPGMRVTDLIASYKDLLPEPASQYAEIIRLNAPDYRPTVESFNLADALSHPASAPVLEPLDTVQIFGRYDFENFPAVSVGGDVRKPGTYRTSGQLHLSDAIHMAGGLAPDAEQEDAQVFRYLPDGQTKIFSVKLAAAMAGDPTENIVLDSRDRILVHRNVSGVDPAAVYVEGEVARPGRYPLAANMTVADLIQAAGGPKQSADLKSADLTRYDWTSESRMTGEHATIELTSLAIGNDSTPTLHNGDVVTVRKLPGWDDLGASITVRGEVVHAGSYGIRPGERLSSILKRAGGFMPDAYPYGAVLVRDEVQRLEDKSQTELVDRVREEQAGLKLAAKSEQDADAKQADEAAYQQWQETLDHLTSNPPLGRVTIQISANIKSWEGTARDVPVRAGDRLIIPKRPSYVMVQGQVFNPTAVAFRPGKSARWYLSQAGGPTNLANKKSIFVIRADGTVIGSHGSSLFLGSALSDSLQPGDMVMVPEKALGGPSTWKSLFQTVQISSAIVTSAVIAARY
jgi:polysaccharide biosynthesis/export protein